MRYVLLALLGMLASVMGGPNGASGTTGSYPDSMASLGDSITRAANPGAGLFGDQPQYSWSTGSDITVESHYYRILQQNSLIAGNNYNFAVSGAKLADLSGQAANAVSQGVDYVTILMGANDVCTSGEATMTPVESFRIQFQTAMNTLAAGLPNADILVVSIPDIYSLWVILKDNPSAVFFWNLFAICQSMLENPTSVAQADLDRRNRVRQRNVDFNTVLGEECPQYTNCRFDNNAVFSNQFVASDVSPLDYFHPSIAGQTKLAAGTWDSDGDMVVDGVDNCLDTANPGQTDTDGDGEGDACDLDDDNDSLGLGDSFGLFFRDEVEVFIGTLPGFACAATPDIDDEDPDALGPDWDDSMDVDGSDVSLFADRFGTDLGVPPPIGKQPYIQRFDIYPTDASLHKIDGSDVSVLAEYFGDSCP